MSDTIIKVFPRYYYPTYTDEQIISAINILQITSKEKITFTNYKSVQFIDCGEGLKHIFCPWCGCKIDFGFWQEAMDKAYSNGSFKHLGVQMPCCNLSSSLDELIYIKPCGFSTFVIEINNPENMPCRVELHEMGKCFGSVNFFKMILTHI